MVRAGSRNQIFTLHGRCTQRPTGQAKRAAKLPEHRLLPGQTFTVCGAGRESESTIALQFMSIG